jgi:hypothetical protein
MAVLLSNGTAQRLLTLLGDPRPDPARSDRQRSAFTRAPEPGVAYEPPWTVRWSTAADSYIVYIPSGSAGIGTGTINHTAVTDMADWYTFAGDAGVVYAWWASGKINVGMTPPTDAGTIIAVIAEAEDGSVTITQIARSVLDMIVSLAEILTPSHVLGKKTVSGVVTYGWVPTVTHASQHPESD